MRKKYQYARWVADKMKHASNERKQEIRGAYYSNSGRVEHYDEYAKWCRDLGYDYDDSPEGYWDSKIKDWHQPTGILMAITGVFLGFIALVIGGSTGQAKK
jgi:hypothetical protein